MFNNSYSRLPDKFFERNKPEVFSEPSLLSFNQDLAREIDFLVPEGFDVAHIFSGQQLLDGMDPLAQAYAGFQFGHPVSQLGDGRALLLGEVGGFDIQLKGSGRTRFSRRGDGRSSLGPVVREYLVSEFMHQLGVPTTRALAAVRTGEMVYRQDGPEPGGIFTRVAKSHLRVGTFQYFYFKEDYEAIETLVDYSIQRHYPALLHINNTADKCLAFLKEVGKAQADLIAHWTSLGFIHGVMNTDNYSIAGLTIDYGPCAFMDEFKIDKVFSSIDHQGRYSYFNQVPIGKWNLLRLADCLIHLIDSDQNKAIDRVQEELNPIMYLFEEKRWRRLGLKLGIQNFDLKDIPLIQEFLEYMQEDHLDFTLSFRNLPQLFNGEEEFYPQNKKLESFKKNWKSRVDKVEGINEINPLYIPRNHQIERIIQASFKGDDQPFKEMLEVMKSPFKLNEKLHHYAKPPETSERVYQTFCGT